MYSFVVTVRPKSYNSWGSASKNKKQTYKQALDDALQLIHPACSPMQGDLYGLVYHFHKIDLGIDADNLSKPIWDCLKGILFTDDKQVKMRIAGSFSIQTEPFAIFESSQLPGTVITSLATAVQTEQHILYIECGPFTTDLIRLNLGGNGN